MAVRVASLEWMLALSQRRIHALSFTALFQVFSCRSAAVVAQPFWDVTWRERSCQGCNGKTASVLPACTICTSMSSGPRSMLKATECRGLLRVALQLGLLHAAVASHDLIHWEKAARSLVDLHDAVCADSVCARQPAQLDEQPVRVGVLLLRAVDLFHALGGLLEAPKPCMSRCGQLRPTDRAMARLARTSSSEEESRSTDEDERLLTKRCIEGQWKNTWETLV